MYVPPCCALSVATVNLCRLLLPVSAGVPHCRREEAARQEMQDGPVRGARLQHHLQSRPSPPHAGGAPLRTVTSCRVCLSCSVLCLLPTVDWCSPHWFGFYLFCNFCIICNVWGGFYSVVKFHIDIIDEGAQQHSIRLVLVIEAAVGKKMKPYGIIYYWQINYCWITSEMLRLCWLIIRIWLILYIW